MSEKPMTAERLAEIKDHLRMLGNEVDTSNATVNIGDDVVDDLIDLLAEVERLQKLLEAQENSRRAMEDLEKVNHEPPA